MCEEIPPKSLPHLPLAPCACISWGVPRNARTFFLADVPPSGVSRVRNLLHCATRLPIPGAICR